MIKKISTLLILLFIGYFFFNAKGLYSFNSQEGEDQEKLEYEVAVTLKLIQIYVTDKKGNPVSDLEKSDFQVFDNGKIQEITDFERHVLSLPSEESRIREGGKADVQPVKMGRKFFLFFDFAFNDFTGMNIAKKAALHFINTQVNPNDEVAVLSYSGRKGLVMHEYLTSDQTKVHEVINQLGYGETLGRAGQLLDELSSETVGGGGGAGRQQLIQQAREQFVRMAGEGQLRHQAKEFCLALSDWAKALRYIPGTKNIILFSIGVPNFVMYPLGPSISPQMNTMNLRLSSSTDLRIRYEKMSKELEASNSPVFAVNVEGLYTGSMRREGESMDTHLATKPRQAFAGILDKDWGGEDSLLNIAKLTGGKYFDNTNDYKQIAEDIQKLTGSYYVLGYYTDETWDGKHHKVLVKVKRAGCKVYGQRGYFNPKPFHEYSNLEKKIHLVDLALGEKGYFENPIDFSLVVLPFSFENESYMTMLTKIPAGSMEGSSDSINEIIFLVFNEQKNVVGYKRIEADAARFQQKDVFCYIISPFIPGEFTCRVVIRNLENGRGAVASESVLILPHTPSELRMHPPLVLYPKGEALYIDIADPEKEGSALAQVYPFDPSEYSPLVGELKEKTSELLVVSTCSIFDIPNPEIHLSAHLVYHETGESIPLDFTLDQKPADDSVVFLLKIQTDSLQPGTYFLHLFAEEAGTQAKSRVHTTFTIQ
jgi:VWFA-related protein